MARDCSPGLARAADLDLARLAAGGDDAAFGELMRRAAPIVSDLLRRMGAQPALADDIAQDALIAAHRGIAAFRGDAVFTTWVMSIAARLYVKRCRKEARTEVMAEPIGPDEPAPDPQWASEMRLDLDRAMARLSAPERLCVGLCHGAGMTHEEIAKSLGAPLGTVKSHVLRGVKKLRVLLAPSAEVSDGRA